MDIRRLLSSMLKRQMVAIREPECCWRMRTISIWAVPPKRTGTHGVEVPSRGFLIVSASSELTKPFQLFSSCITRSRTVWRRGLPECRWAIGLTVGAQHAPEHALTIGPPRSTPALNLHCNVLLLL